MKEIYADKDGIERVVLNILSNSVKYTGNGGTIKIYVGFVYNDEYVITLDELPKFSKTQIYKE